MGGGESIISYRKDSNSERDRTSQTSIENGAATKRTQQSHSLVMVKNSDTIRYRICI